MTYVLQRHWPHGNPLVVGWRGELRGPREGPVQQGDLPVLAQVGGASTSRLTTSPELLCEILYLSFFT